MTRQCVTTTSFEERLQARQNCRQKEKELLDLAAALGKDMPERELAAHLGAAGAGPDAVREREAKIRNGIALEKERHTARRLRRDRGMSMQGCLPRGRAAMDASTPDRPTIRAQLDPGMVTGVRLIWQTSAVLFTGILGKRGREAPNS